MADNKSTSEYGASRERQINFNEFQNAVQKYFGKNPVIESAIYGNSDVETGGSFSYKQKQYGNGPGIGLFQFDFHKPHYRKFLKEEGLSDSTDSQVRYVFENIYGKKKDVLGAGNAARLRRSFQSDDPLFVSSEFLDVFLKPNPDKQHRDRRMNSTNRFYKQLTQ